MIDANTLNLNSKGLLPDLLGIKMLDVGDGYVESKMVVAEHHMAPNGFLHAASIVALADTSCGNGAVVNLPEGAAGFTTIELKSNHLSTVKSGTIRCSAKAIHLGRQTQVWDAEVTSEETGKTLAHFRCTQMILYR